MDFVREKRALDHISGNKAEAVEQLRQNVDVLTDGITEMGLFGVTNIRTAQTDKEHLQAIFQNHRLIENKEFKIVQPKRNFLVKRFFPKPPEDWHVKAIGFLEKLNNGFEGTGHGIKLAVIDTGISQIPELHNKVLRSFKFNRNSKKTQAVPIEQSFDTDDHGTGVAALAVGLSKGIARQAKLIDVCAMPGTLGETLSIIQGLDIVANDSSIQIANISGGIRGAQKDFEIILQKIEKLGRVIVAAIGNNGAGFTEAPANGRSAISVGSMTFRRNISRSSGGGSKSDSHGAYDVPNIVGPGQDVFVFSKNGTSMFQDGNSFAAPLVSGVVALILEQFPNISLDDLRSMLFMACKPLGVSQKHQGHGLLQIPATLDPDLIG